MNILSIVAVFVLLAGMLRAESPVPLNVLKGALNQPAGDLAQIARGWLADGGGNRLFYLPTWDEPATPRDWGHRHQEVWFDSDDNTKLHGWFIEPIKGKAKGTVVFSHGNAGSMGHHLGFVMWLSRVGYQVLMYDYRGFGKSGGSLDRKGMVEDVSAAFRYASSRKDTKGLDLISYGHSLGGAKSITALARNPIRGLKAVVVDGAFASYAEMAAHFGGKMGESLVTDDLSPQDYIDRISPTPLLIIHGKRDEVVPFAQGKALFDRAKQPKTIFEVEEGKHGDSLVLREGEYRKRMMAWLDGLK